MKIIYIRHGQKKYPNNFKSRKENEKAHDSPLSAKGLEQMNEIAYKLRDKAPEVVIVSPYTRTRQSCQVLTSLSKDVRVIVDPVVSEYLGNQNFTELDDCTKNYNPPNHEETINHLDTRVAIHGESLKVHKDLGVNCIWVISHGLFISKAVDYWVQQIFYPDEGEYIEIDI